MQTNLGGPIETVTVSFVYTARYGYSDSVIHNDNHLRIFPREGEGQFGPEAEIWSIPLGRGVDYTDRFGNRVRRLRVVEPHTTFTVVASGTVQLSTGAPTARETSIASLRDLPESFEFASVSPLVDPDSVAGLARDVAGQDDSLINTVRQVIGWVYENILYKRGATSVATTANEVMAAGEGVCQDKTHLALGMLRSLKIPCRYASGLLTGQTGETHSWVEFFHPDEGWLGADPTRGLILPSAWDYVKFGVGRDYTDVSPVTGSFLSKGGTESIAAIAQVRFGGIPSTLSDALELLQSAYIVQNEASPASYPISSYPPASYPIERPERDR